MQANSASTFQILGLKASFTALGMYLFVGLFLRQAIILYLGLS